MENESINNICPIPKEIKLFVYKNKKTESFLKHVNNCHKCQISIRLIQEEKKLKLNWEEFSTAVYRKIRTVPSSILTLWENRTGLMLTSILTILCVVFVLFFLSRHYSITSDKQPSINYEIKEGAQFIKGEKDKSLKPNSQIRIHATSIAYDYLLLISIDTYGTIKTYYPSQGTQSLPIPNELDYAFPDTITLPGSLNDAVFLGIFSKSPLEVTAAEQAIRDELDHMRKKDKELQDFPKILLGNPVSKFYLSMEKDK